VNDYDIPKRKGATLFSLSRVVAAAELCSFWNHIPQVDGGWPSDSRQTPMGETILGSFYCLRVPLSLLSLSGGIDVPACNETRDRLEASVELEE
jgi:hypothetical protein